MDAFVVDTRFIEAQNDPRLEVDNEVGRDSPVKGAFGLGQSFFGDDTKIHILAKFRAEAGANRKLRLTFQIRGAEINQISAFCVQSRVHRALRQAKLSV